MCITQNNSRPCPNCATGKKDYELDKTSLFCEHILCLKNGKCRQYVPLTAVKSANEKGN